MRPNVLFVEDEEALRMTVGDRLRSEGYIVDCACDGGEGFEKAMQLPFDVIILDLMLPERDGLSICRDLRQAGLITPLLMLTAKGRTDDKILGLKTGADDYLTKPFDTEELVARIEALLRRAPIGAIGNRDVYQFATVRVDRRAMEVTRDGKPVALSIREFQLLKYLIENAGATIRREQLLTDVWGYHGDMFTRTIDVHIASLRQKLENDPRRPVHIQTVQRVGYKFVPGTAAS
jgi:two-component system alkaline phosphatase synthesis response regulator PhoP